MGLLNTFGVVSGKTGDKKAKNRIFSYFSSLNIYKSTFKYEYSTGYGSMKPKLTLKTNTLSILITIWGLWVLIAVNQGVK